jgi:hypothetical protein
VRRAPAASKGQTTTQTEPLESLGHSPTIPRPDPGDPRPELPPDRRCTAPRGHIAKTKIFPKASLQKRNWNSKSEFADSCKLRRKSHKIRKMQGQFCWIHGELF